MGHLEEITLCLVKFTNVRGLGLSLREFVNLVCMDKKFETVKTLHVNSRFMERGQKRKCCMVKLDKQISYFRNSFSE